MPELATLPPLSLYIHLPWCVRKCPYCDFNSHAVRGELPEEHYVAILLKDLEIDLPRVTGRQLSSIFIGGGTPSLFSGKAISQLLSAIKSRLDFAADIEITLEANPGTVDESHFAAYRAAGVNRLSIGVQSFNSAALKSLGRIHDGDAAIKAVNVARSVGFDNINIDLMFGLPNQSIAAAMQDLEIAIACIPTHLSWYQLTLEPNTLFYHQPPPLPADEESWLMQQQGIDYLAANRFHRYEVSAFSQNGKECQHNLNYWLFGDYLGIGAGAHSKITDATLSNVTRLIKIKHPTSYMQAQNNWIAEQHLVSAAELPFEFMLNVLRLNRPVAWNFFSERTGLPATALYSNVQRAVGLGLLHDDGTMFCPTEKGYQFLNDLIAMFLE